MVLEVGRLSLQPGRLSEIKCVVFVTERYELGCRAGGGVGGRGALFVGGGGGSLQIGGLGGGGGVGTVARLGGGGGGGGCHYRQEDKGSGGGVVLISFGVRVSLQVGHARVCGVRRGGGGGGRSVETVTGV